MRIPVTIYEEIKVITQNPNEFETAASVMHNLWLAFNDSIKWIEGVPYNVQIQTTVPKS